MGYTGERYSIPAYPIKELLVTECGLTECDNGHYTPIRTYVCYAAHFILRGKGRFMVSGQVYELQEGQGFMIFPDIPCSYVADEDDPWHYIYVCFACDRRLMHHAGLDESHPTYTFERTEQMVSSLYAMLESGKDKDNYGYAAASYLLFAMSQLVAAHTATHTTVNTEHSLYHVITYIENHYADRISIEDIALQNHMDRSTLNRLFKKHRGTTPSEFLLSFRLRRAEMMLKFPELSISDIAYACGFCTVAHFSRSFSEKFGQSPTQYRKTRQIR